MTETIDTSETVRGISSVAELKTKITEVATDANSIKKDFEELPKGNTLEQYLKGKGETTGAVNSSKPAGEVKHSNKKTDKNPRGGGVYQYNDECQCDKCKVKRNESPSAAPGATQQQAASGNVVAMNIDVICTMQNNLLLGPMELVLDMPEGALAHTREDQELLNQVKPEGGEMKRSWSLYWTLNITMIIGKLFKALIFWKRKKREQKQEMKKAA